MKYRITPSAENPLRYYIWGDEEPGYVSIWIKGKKGGVISLGHLKQNELPKNSKHESPYN